MARQKKNVGNGINSDEQTKNTQEEIEAALNRACGQTQSPVQNKTSLGSSIEQPMNCVKNETTDNVIDKCDINIDAKDCFKTSIENQDKSILGYVRDINKRIKNESLHGGYSTNITLCVVPNKWVNVQHIIDWYRAHGFDVTVDEVKQPQYGIGAGSMEYNFNISWVHAQ